MPGLLVFPQCMSPSTQSRPGILCPSMMFPVLAPHAHSCKVLLSHEHSLPIRQVYEREWTSWAGIWGLGFGLLLLFFALRMESMLSTCSPLSCNPSAWDIDYFVPKLIWLQCRIPQLFSRHELWCVRPRFSSSSSSAKAVTPLWTCFVVAHRRGATQSFSKQRCALQWCF